MAMHKEFVILSEDTVPKWKVRKTGVQIWLLRSTVNLFVVTRCLKDSSDSLLSLPWTVSGIWDQ